MRGLGENAYVVLQFHGWMAAAQSQTRVIVVTANGGTITADKTLTLLRAAMSHKAARVR